MKGKVIHNDEFANVKCKQNVCIVTTLLITYKFLNGNLTIWSGRRESNPPQKLGRLLHYHYATPA